jgi:hypothetical protein
MKTTIPQFTRIQTAILVGLLMSTSCLTVPDRAAADPSDALYIDANGNVGIGTSLPQATLDVAGDLNVSESATITESLTTGVLNVTKNANLATTAVNGGLTSTGNGVIGNVFLGDVGHGPAWAGFSHRNSVSTTGYGFLHHNSGQYALINKKSGGGWIGLRINNADKMVVADNGNVGVGTTTPADKVDIAGTVRMLTGSNPIRFTSRWSGFPDATSNQAEISNDTTSYKTLMIIGNKSGDGRNRRVSVWDRLEVNGDLYVSKDIWYQKHKFVFAKGLFRNKYNVEATSDLRLKKDIHKVTNALEKVNKLQGVTYRWNENALRYFTSNIETALSAGPNATEADNQKLWQAERDKRYRELAKSNVGVVAQDVEAVLPEAVTTDEAGYKSVRYHYLIPLLIEAVKEQERTVNAQSQLVAKQQQEIERLTAANLTIRQQLAELAAVKAQVARLKAALQRFATIQTGESAGGAMARLLKTSSH